MGMNMLPTPDDYSMLQRENEQLKIENSDLRREMDGLKATVKVLMDETANMRLEAKTGAQYGGGFGQQSKPESRYSQGRDEGSQSGGWW